MMMFEDIGLCGDMEFFSGKLPEKDLGCLQDEPEATVEDDYTDDEIDIDELERRMWRDKMRLKRLKEQNKSREGVDMVKQLQSQEQARRKKMSRTQDGILKPGERRCQGLKMSRTSFENNPRLEGPELLGLASYDTNCS